MGALRILRLLSVIFILENFNIMQNKNDSFYEYVCLIGILVIKKN